MERFLETVADELIATGKSGDRIMVVLPGRRAALFMEQYYSRKVDNGWLPRCVAVEDLMVELSGLEKGDDIALLLELYESYAAVEGLQAQSMRDFLKWAPAVLADFNELDLYASVPNDIFKNIANAKVIESWNPEGGPPTEGQNKYLSFWRQLDGIYKDFNARLNAQSIGYQGAIYKRAVTALGADSTLLFEQSDVELVCFAGFNALTGQESRLFDLYKSDERFKIFWDADAYYLADPKQEAGHFIRTYVKRWPKSRVVMSHGLSEKPKNIQAHGIGSGVGQTLLAGTLLQELSVDEPDDVACILADESLLLPMLSAVPDNGQVTNVTMGYPLKWSPGGQFFKMLFRVQDSSTVSSKGVIRYYYKHLFDLLNSPVLSEEPGAAQLKQLMLKSNLLYPTYQDCLDLLVEPSDLMVKLLTLASQGTSQDALDWAIDVGRTLLASERVQEVHGEGLTIAMGVLDQFKWHIDRHQLKFEFSLLRGLISQLIDQVKVPFSGEPLSGLQIMGMLESRSLDFKHLVILSANEGIMPGGKNYSSLIPPDIRKAFGLPTNRDQDSIFAYHFYRLIQRASNVHLIYDSRQEALQSGEKSRYILQLAMEWAGHYKGAEFTENNVSTPYLELKQQEIATKDGQVQTAIETYLTNGISPSAINTYVRCPQDFFYQYIVGIRESDQMEENPEASTIGTIAHTVLEEMYTPFIGKVMTSAEIGKLVDRVDSMLVAEFEKKFPKGGWKRGRVFIAYKAAHNEIQKMIRLDVKLLKQAEAQGQVTTLLGLEEQLSSEIEFQGRTFKIAGLVDRIQRVGNEIQVLDYKSGQVKDVNVGVVNIEDLLTNKEKAKAFQLLCYATFAWEKYGGPGKTLVSGNMSFKDSNKVYFVSVAKQRQYDDQMMAEFKGVLVELFDQMLDPELPIAHNPKSEYCLLCH